MGIFTHREQIMRLHEHWNRKPALQKVYSKFYRLIASHLTNQPDSKVVELGSGIGNLKEIIPQCITTDMFPTPWSELVENAYELSFQDETLSDLILVDVFHHLQYPGTALTEFHRVLKKGGQVLIFEPCISVAGLIVFGLLHPEGLKFNHSIQWTVPPNQMLESPEYYTSQGNATRIFLGSSYRKRLELWREIKVTRLSASSYVASGGYTKPQMLPDKLLPLLGTTERLFDLLPWLFATRMLVILVK
jgi:SAM-dependent methyltransferase